MKKHLSFHGRTKRFEYWCALLSTQVLFPAIAIVAFLVSGIRSFWIITLFITVYSVVIWHYLSTVKRRCSDIGITKWRKFIVFLPYINISAVILLGCLRTDAHKNPEAQKLVKILSSSRLKNEIVSEE